MASPEIENIIDEIRTDKTHGASELAKRAIEVIKIAARCSRAPGMEEFLGEQQEVGELLMQARPTIAPIFNMVKDLLDRITYKTDSLDLESARLTVISEADNIISASLRAIDQIARNAVGLAVSDDIILTHSYSSTVIAAVEAIYEGHENIMVIATRSGAGRTGEIIARQLASMEIPVTLIDDTAVGLYLRKVNKVMVGADRICADGNIINGIGTYPIACGAEKAGIPLYVLCETPKFDVRLKAEDVDLEDKEPSEVADTSSLPSGVGVYNPHFEITPLGLVTGVVTENGVLAPADVIGYINELAG